MQSCRKDGDMTTHWVIPLAFAYIFLCAIIWLTLELVAEMCAPGMGPAVAAWVDRCPYPLSALLLGWPVALYFIFHTIWQARRQRRG